ADLERDARAVAQRELRGALQHGDPLVAGALEPLAGRRPLPRGDDPLDEDAVASGEPVEPLILHRLGRELEQIHRTAAATSAASDSTESRAPLTRSTRWSQRMDAPGAKSRSASRFPAA